MSNTPTHGSDVQETPDWWKASDGRFYPPELHPDYVKPAAPAAPAAAPAVAAGDVEERSTPSLAERLRAEADRVGDEAAAAADAGVGSMDTSPSISGVKDTLGDAKSTVEGAVPGIAGAVGGAAGAAGAAAAAAADAVPGMPPVGTPPAVTPPAATPPAATPPSAADPRATMPATPPQAAGLTETVMQKAAPVGTPPSVPPATPPAAVPPVSPPSVPPSPAVPPSLPAPGMPPAPGAQGSPPAPSTPPGMPPAPTSPPAMPSPLQDPIGETVQGPGGITYTAAPDATPSAMATMPGGPPQPGGPQIGAPGLPPTEQQPAVPTAKSKVASSTAGAVAALGGIAAIAGSFLNWGKGSVIGADGAEKALIEVAGFDSSGMITAICGAVLLLSALLFFTGTPKQTNWAILAFLAGAAIVGSVVFSMIDIGDLSNRYAAQWQDEGLAAVGDVISTQGDLGLWIAGAGGVLGVLSAPFVNR